MNSKDKTYILQDKHNKYSKQMFFGLTDVNKKTFKYLFIQILICNKLKIPI